ncbi:MAG TPA: flagellar hook basal-body protein [Vicinamibacterales bacterium]
MKARLDDLDRLASDLANVGTSGYKTERTATSASERPSFRAALDSAVDATSGSTRVDLRPGTIGTTGRDLDVAIEGRGFFVVSTPGGERFTRNGSLSRRADGVLTVADGSPVLGDAGEIRVGRGSISVEQDGSVRVGDTVAGRLRVVDFEKDTDVVRESGVRFKARPGVTPQEATPRIVGGALEQANVSTVDRMVSLTEVSRSFEALQRGVSVLMNDIDGRAITELGRR